MPNNTNNTNTTAELEYMSSARTKAFCFIWGFLILFAFITWLYHDRGWKPTSRVTFTCMPTDRVEEIECSFNILGRINPEQE